MKNKQSNLLEKLEKNKQLCLECKNFIENMDIYTNFISIEKLTILEKTIIDFLKKLLKILANKYLSSKIDTIMIDNLISNLKEIKLDINNASLKFLNSINSTEFNIQDIYNYKKDNINVIYKQPFKNLFDLYYFDLIKKPKFLVQFNQNPKDDYYTTRNIKRHFIISFGPTNTGKTYNALQSLELCNKGIYLAPLRLLAIQVYDLLKSKNIECNLKTGEEEIFNNASITSATIEELNMDCKYDIAIIDEAQMINDTKRGWAWTRAILGIIANKIYICCSYNAVDLIKLIIEDLGDTFEIIEHQRNIPLIIERKKFIFPNSIHDGDALVVFSRIKALQVAAILEDAGISSSILYGNLPPESKKQQFNRFLENKTKVLVTTDAIGMGVNLPIRRIVFLELQKFDGCKLRNLTSTEAKQIAGRAGRIGMFDEGFVNCLENKTVLKKLLEQKDLLLENAYISPLQDILLKNQEINLHNKLNIWKNSFLPINLYKKSDISDMIYLLSILISENITILQSITYKMIAIPFDLKDEELMNLWLNYCKNIYNSDELKFPICQNSSLKSFETYYKSLDLYYQFIKNFNVKGIAIDEILYEKSKISILIDLELIENIRKYKKVCKKCGKYLSWNNIYNYCEICYLNLFSYNDYF